MHSPVPATTDDDVDDPRTLNELEAFGPVTALPVEDVDADVVDCDDGDPLEFGEPAPHPLNPMTNPAIVLSFMQSASSRATIPQAQAWHQRPRPYPFHQASPGSPAGWQSTDPRCNTDRPCRTSRT